MITSSDRLTEANNTAAALRRAILRGDASARARAEHHRDHDRGIGGLDTHLAAACREMLAQLDSEAQSV